MLFSRHKNFALIFLLIFTLVFAATGGAEEVKNNLSKDIMFTDSRDVLSSDIVLIGTIITQGDLGHTPAGKYYSQELQTMGDAIWTQTGGTLPEGLRLTQSGVLEGTPVQTGRYEFLLKAAFTSSDQDSNSETKNFSLWVTEGEGVPPVIVTDYELEDGHDGDPYNVRLEAKGYGGGEVTWPLTWELTGGELPEGLTLSASGVIFGEPSQSGIFLFTITVTNPADSTYRVFSLNVRPKAPKITTQAIPAGMLDDPYEFALEAEGSKPIKWSLSEPDPDSELLSGKLPEGLLFDSLTGTLSGIPTEAGTFIFTIEAANDAGTDEKEFMLEIEDPGVAITPENFPDKAFREFVELTYDRDENGYLDNDETKFVVDMELNNLDISSLEGLKYFPELISLKCSRNNLTALDTSENKNVQYIHCMENNISEINVTGNENLLILNAYANNLSAVDLSTNPVLEILDVSYNRLGEIDLSKNVNLEELNCSGNNLEAIDLTENKTLIEANLASNDLTEIDTSKNIYLKSLEAGRNKLTALNLTENVNLEYLDCSNNSFMELDLESNTSLQGLKCDSQFSSGLLITKTDTELYNVNLAQVLKKPEKVAGDLEHKIRAFNHDGELISEVSTFSNASVNYPEIPAAIVYDYDTGFIYASENNNYMDVTFRVNEAPAIITPEVISLDAKAGTYFSYKLDAAGDLPIVWSLNSGNLPSGLELTESGDIKGTPEIPGTYEFEITATNSKGSDTRAFSITVKSFVPVITTESLPYGQQGSTYSFTLETDIKDAFTWSITEGSLPEGLTLRSDGLIIGIPLEGGAFNFTVQAVNLKASEPAVKSFTLEILDVEIEDTAPVITTSVLKYAKAGVGYEFLIEAVGAPTIRFKITEGRLPDGLRLAQDGKITGTARESGRFYFTVEAKNDSGSSHKEFMLNVRPSIITASTLPDTNISSSSNSLELQLYGTNPDMTWCVVGGSFPEGMKLDIKTGSITGRPTRTGDHKFVIRAEIAGWSDLYDEREFSIKIKGIAAKINTIALKQGVVNTRYSFTLQASGTGQIKWQASGLPRGLSLRYNKYKGTATISGTPLKAGRFDVTFTVSGTWGSQVKTLPLVIQNVAPQITTTSLSAAAVGSDYSFTLRADGAADGDPLIWKISWLSSNYIHGLKFDSQGNITGVPSKTVGSVNNPGDYALSVTVKNSAGSDTREFTITLKAADESLKPSIKSSGLKDAAIGSSYSEKLSASGSGITWQMSWPGKKIRGLKIDPETGAITGVPSDSNKAGSYNVKIIADNFAGSVSKTFVIRLTAKTNTAKTADKKKKSSSPVKALHIWNYNYDDTVYELYDDEEEISLEDLKKFADESENEDPESERDSDLDSESESESKKESELKSETEKEQQEQELSEELKDLLMKIEDKEYIVAVIFPQISAKESGQYEFEATLNKHVQPGAKLIWFARPINAVESEDDEIIDFYDKDGNPIEEVPEDRSIIVSPWLRSEVIYQPIVAVEAKKAKSK